MLFLKVLTGGLVVVSILLVVALLWLRWGSRWRDLD
jgi:hypothetical protein